ncbi:MAG: HAD family hydrolase [Clostridia bacterium]
MSIINKKQSVIIIDLDGTLCEFEKKDKEIIALIFDSSKIVMALDKILRKINNLDIIKTSNGILKARLRLYSMLVGRFDFVDVYEDYHNEYRRDTKQQLKKVYEKDILRLKEKGYEIIILSNNSFSKDLVMKENIDAKFILVVTTNKSNAILQLKRMLNINIKYIIGNNISEDIIPSNKQNVNSLYIGKSKIARTLARKITTNKGSFSNISQAVNYIIN